jgi:hypothetical protein
MNEEIKKSVIAYIASCANTPASGIKDEYILRDHPLQLDNEKLGFLAIALRTYVKSLNSAETVLVTEVRRAGMTVKKTCELIIKKITA